MISPYEGPPVRAIRTLYWSHIGTRCVGWWETPPPRLLAERRICPRFREPDIFHDRTVGSEEDVIRDFQSIGILPKQFRLVRVPQEWVDAGLRRIQEAKVQHRRPKPDPEKGGLFSAEYVKPVSRDGVPG